MGILELLLAAVGVSMDAFAASVCSGLAMKRATLKKAVIIGLYFGTFQALMPLAGFFIGLRFSSLITNVDHWLAFLLLSIIGGKMLYEGLKKTGCTDRECPAEKCGDRECPDGGMEEEPSLKPMAMLPMAVATSIDALAVGASFAFLEVEIFSAVALIGATTLLFSIAGVKIGGIFGNKIKSKAEVAGGIILILIGIKILLEHSLT